MASLRKNLAAVALAGAVMFGGASVADAKPVRPADRVEAICARKAHINKALNNQKKATEKRIKNLQAAIERHKKAGHTQAVARLEKALARAQRHLAQIDQRIAKFAQFVAANCK